MALEQLIKKGEKEIEEKDYLSAIATFSTALRDNPKAFQAYIKRSIAYQKLKNFDAARKDISDAFTIAEKRGKRANLGICYFRLGLINYGQGAYNVALVNFGKAKEYDCDEPTLPTWRAKCEYDLKKKQEEKSTAAAKETGVRTASKPSVEAPNSANPQEKADTSKMKIRDDWYQTAEFVIITIYAKNVDRQELQVHFDKRSLSVSFPSSEGAEYNYNLDPLYADIIGADSFSKVLSTKIEITLKKASPAKWVSLEGSYNEPTAPVQKNITADSSEPPLSYPSSSKKAINWDAFKLEDDEEDEKNENDFFAKLYRDTDDDTRRAMMKSYVESNGTVLTTNWDEAKDKRFETSPPEGMVAKKWNS